MAMVTVQGCGFLAGPTPDGAAPPNAPLNLVIRNRTASELRFDFESTSAGSSNAGAGTVPGCAITPISFPSGDQWWLTLDGNRVLDSTHDDIPVLPPANRQEFTVILDVEPAGARVTGVHPGPPGGETEVQLDCPAPSPSG
jgi:hypothetical protein